jgi:hypothetical protein
MAATAPHAPPIAARTASETTTTATKMQMTNSVFEYLMSHEGRGSGGSPGADTAPLSPKQACHTAKRSQILTIGPMMRYRTHRLYPRTLGPRELEALRLVEQRPGSRSRELADAMGVSMQRAWQYIGRLEAGRVRRDRA